MFETRSFRSAREMFHDILHDKLGPASREVVGGKQVRVLFGMRIYDWPDKDEDIARFIVKPSVEKILREMPKPKTYRVAAFSGEGAEIAYTEH